MNNGLLLTGDLSTETGAVVSLLELAELTFFIDGDHTYEGVSKDFSLFSPLVRKGGRIIFHDIVPDFRHRYGTETRAVTGGVPEFWKELKLLHPHEEIIEDPDQDGYGIGVINWQGDSGLESDNHLQ
jgi:hypothetical protein